MGDPFSTITAALGLLALFETSISFFDRIQLARHFDRDATTCQLRLDDARARICRWGRSIEVENEEQAIRVLGAERTEKAKQRLMHIKKIFEDAERKVLGKKKDEPQGSSAEFQLVEVGAGEAAAPVGTSASTVRSKLRGLYPSRVLHKTAWALNGYKAAMDLLEALEKVIDGLELLVPERSDALQTLAAQEVNAIQDREALTALVAALSLPRQNTQGTASQAGPADALLGAAANEYLRAHIYKDTSISDNAILQEGNMFLQQENGEAISMPTWRPPGNEYIGTRISGNAKVLQGDRYGVKKDFFDM